MNNHDNLIKATTRICAISWQHNPLHDSSNIQLLREYFRRSTLWAKALDCLGEWPFFDVIEHAAPNIIVDEAIIYQIDECFDDIFVPSRMIATCKWFVRWSLACDQPEVHMFHLPPPYEPLIRMYEQGGHFYSEHGFFYVGDRGFSRGVWSNYDQHEPFVLLEESDTSG